MATDSIAALERHNLRQIEMLNQRGGRTLSIADLMEAGTITPEAAGFALWHVAHGASFLTGAVPGGAGKSTLLADLLGMLPPGEEIVTTPDDRAVGAAGNGKQRNGRCFLCHEFGSGMWHGYLWGPTVGRFMELMDRGGRIAGCLHADDAVQTRDILVSPTLGVDGKTFAEIGLLLYMAIDREGVGASRRVDSIWVPDGDGRHRIAYAWDSGSGELVEMSEPDGDVSPPPTLDTCQGFMHTLAAGRARLFEDVRAATVEFYGSLRDG